MWRGAKTLKILLTFQFFLSSMLSIDEFSWLKLTVISITRHETDWWPNFIFKFKNLLKARNVSHGIKFLFARLMGTHFRMLNSNWFLEIILQLWQSYLIKNTMSILVPLIWFIDSPSIFFFLVTSGLELVSYWIGVRLCFGQLYCNERHFALTHNSLQTHIHTQSCESSKRNFLKTSINWACRPLDLYAYIYESKLSSFLLLFTFVISYPIRSPCVLGYFLVLDSKYIPFLR